MQTFTYHLHFILSRLLRSSILLALALGLTSAAAVFVPGSVPAASAQFETAPVERLLNGDGTLNLSTGFNGSLDLRGWDVTLDSQRGPILARASGDAETIQDGGEFAVPGGAPAAPMTLAWSAFPHNGLNGIVYAITVSGSDLYVGGSFTATGDGTIALNRIAKFSGGAWSALAHNGLNGTVHALAVSGSDLYVGGLFTGTADGAATNLYGIAKYSGGAWSALPNNGLDGGVLALAVSGNELYVGGLYLTQTADGAVTGLNNIAKSSGGAWSALPHNGLNGAVYALVVNGSDLYASGQFTQTADSAVTNLNRVARYSLDIVPAITTQPSNRTACPGSSVSFTAAASGFPTPTAQWQSSSNGGVSFGDITGATTPTLTFVVQVSDNNRRYRAVFTNAAGNVASNAATLTVSCGVQLPMIIR